MYFLCGVDIAAQTWYDDCIFDAEAGDMRKRILIPLFAIGIAAAVAFAVLSFVDIIPARSVLPGLDANGNEIFIERTYWFSIYELMCADGTLGSTVIFIMSCAVYGLTAVGCASGIYLCASARGQKLGKAFFGACVSVLISVGLSVLLFLVCRVAAFGLTPCF